MMMMKMKKKLACCTRHKEISLDFDEQERIMTYNGLESFIINNHSYENESSTSRGEGCATDSLDEDASSCSSSNYIFGSFSSHSAMMKRDEEWEVRRDSPKHFRVEDNETNHVADLETMKEKFAKLLLGEDITGGRKGISTALALSNSITTLSASLFGELWKLEPLPEERKGRWKREMDWLLSPTNYMIELVPTKQNGANGRTFEIMTPKARADIQMNLPALRKLDSMLLETLDSMDGTEFWYEERGSRGEGRNNRTERQSKRWWLPSPQVPSTGLSESERKRLLYHGKVVRQVFKAARSINESVLLEMPVPTLIKDAMPKSGKANLGEELYKLLSIEGMTGEEMVNSINLKSEHRALEMLNKLEAAAMVWGDRIITSHELQDGSNDHNYNIKSPIRTSWSSFMMKDPLAELDKKEFLMGQANALIKQLHITFPNLPPTFLHVIKIQYGKDVGHSILEAYSRVLGNLAYKILSRITDILKEDIFMSNPNSPIPTPGFRGIDFPETLDSPGPGERMRHSLTDEMNRAVGVFQNFDKLGISCDEPKLVGSVLGTPSRSRAWCMGNNNI
ncbi:rop guanine nucleotide exchange factor 14-like [Impatiens glandulifera]|uniref:rop guanine nucleotide exchange factor 14-like n=1 Tax=Impatiens glandulifera TaxID=253017 RepID=UPI001FB05815|nr:rop guanine nucleotide exchange factor 14-like [Impatiens glandulifera]